MIKQCHRDYLLDLRDKGTINMLGAGQYLEKAFNLKKGEGNPILKEWIAEMQKQPTVSVSLGDILDSMDLKPYDPLADTLENQLQLFGVACMNIHEGIDRGKNPSKTQLERNIALMQSIVEKM